MNFVEQLGNDRWKGDAAELCEQGGEFAAGRNVVCTQGEELRADKQE